MVGLGSRLAAILLMNRHLALDEDTMEFLCRTRRYEQGSSIAQRKKCSGFVLAWTKALLLLLAHFFAAFERDVLKLQMLHACVTT